LSDIYTCYASFWPNKRKKETKKIEIKLRVKIGNRKSVWFLMPIFGTIIFIFLYILATPFYTGGSQVDQNSIGFS
jgi:hypothetical protein